MSKQLYTFDGIDELYQTAAALPDAEKTGHILAVDAHTADRDDAQRLPWRTPIYVEDTAVGDVSSSEDYYQVIQYGDILDAVGTAIEDYDDTLTPNGYVRLSETGHRMTGFLSFDGIAAEPEAGDVIDLGLNISTGHTGFHGVNYDVGGYRQICSNGMTAFISDFHLDQTHSDPLRYGLAKQAVDSIVDGADAVEDRLQAATEQTFVNQDEALLVLYDTGLDQFFDNAYDTFQDALTAELDAPAETPTLYDTYNAATRAITHDSDLTGSQRERALSQVARLLDQAGTLPAAADLGTAAVERRVYDYTQDADVEPYWDGEEQTLHELAAAHSE